MSIIETPFDLLREMRDAWAFQLHSGKKRNPYPNYIKPSHAYILLFGSMPTSFTRRGLLKKLDTLWADNQHIIYSFTFNFYGRTERINVTNCIDLSDAQDMAIGKLLEYNPELNSKDNILSLINKGEMTINYMKMQG